MAEAEPRGRLRLGMVGGGRGAFIGEAHRIAARLDDRYTLVAGALSSDPQVALASGEELGLAPERVYTGFKAMAQAEATRADGIDVVSVVTPNHLHQPVCQAFLEAGIDVICDKPLATSFEAARVLVATAEEHGRLLGVTYTYTGYPMMREARALAEAGALGEIRLIQAEFALGWLATPVEREGGSKQAEWRTDPERSGPSFVVADLGTHCFHLAEFVARQKAERVAADLHTFVPGRPLEDNAHLMLSYDGGARGTIWASMVAAGENVGLRLRVYGTRGHIAWSQERPDEMHLAIAGEAKRTLVRGGPGLSEAAQHATRIVAGLPEGYYEAFANLYRDYADLIAARKAGATPDPRCLWAPTGAEGARGLAFVEAALTSQKAGGEWTVIG